MEKTLYNQVGEVKGKDSEEQDSFSFQFIPQNENLKRTRGALFTLVTVRGKVDNKAEKAKTFYHAFQSSYYAKASGSIINGLSETLDHLEKEMIQKEAENDVELSLVAAVFWGAVVYLARYGKNSVFVARAGKLKQLDFNKVASGVLEDKDLVCLTSENFAQSVPVEELGELLGKEKLEDILGSIDEKIKDTQAATCVVIRLSVNAPEEMPETLEIDQVNENGETLPTKELSEKEKTPELVEDENEKAENTAELSLEAKREPEPKKTQVVIDALSKAGAKVSEKINKIVKKLLKPWQKPVPGELVDHVAIRRARLLEIAALIIILLLASIFIGANSKGKTKENSQVTALLASAQNNINEAKNFETINPGQAKSLLDSASKDLDNAKKLGSTSSKVDPLENQIASLTAEINRSYKVTNLTEVSDFTKLKSSAAISRIALLADQILATDPSNNSLYLVTITSKAASKLDGSFNNPENVASFASGFYVQNKDNVIMVDTTGKTSSAVSQTNWGTIVGASTYQNNLYLLDSSKSEIWKYVGTSSGLAAARSYLAADKPDLTNASALAIDGFVWVVTKNGTVYKFAQGKKQDFSISNMTDSFGEVVDLYTNVSAKNLYLLDKGKGRIVIIDKEGIYQAQYTNSKLAQATSLAVNEDTQTIYFTSGGKLYSFKTR